MMLFKLALRNVRAHSSKTILVGILLVLAMAVMVVGNSLMDTATRASEDAWIRCYAADLMVRPHYETASLTVLSFMNGSPTEKIRPIGPYPALRDLLDGDGAVKAWSPAVIEWQRFDMARDKYSGGIVVGVDPVKWKATFPDAIDMAEGRFIEPGEEAMTLSWDIVRQVREVLKLPLEVGQIITISPAWGGGAVRDVKLVGVHRYRTGNRFMQMSAYADLKTARKVAGFGLADDTAVASAEASALSDSLAAGGSFDDLFGDMEERTLDGADTGSLEFTEEERALIRSRADEPVPDYREGAFHYATIRLAEGADLQAERARLDAAVKALDPGMEVVTWYDASGGFVHMTEIVRLTFVILVIILSLVTVFVIMNALMISIAERASEIGTLRALGAQKTFVSRLFITESMVLTFGFGFLGIAVALVILGVLNGLGIHIDDGFMAAMFGSSTLKPVLSLPSLAWSILTLVLVGLAASWVPTRQALRLRPVEALGRSS